jgi:phosphoserine phosphatase
MTENTSQSMQFSGLILLTGTDKPGIAAELFETLAPFAVHIIDIEQIVNNNRLILTVLIGANPAHQAAIEEDLNTCATRLEVDIATLFESTISHPLPKNLLAITASSSKMHPKAIARISQGLAQAGANIERIHRTSDSPASFTFTISNVSKEDIQTKMAVLEFEDASTVVVHEVD